MKKYETTLTPKINIAISSFRLSFSHHDDGNLGETYKARN